MISTKKFVFLMVLFLILLFSFHLTVWNIYTKYVFSERYHIGDLGRLSYRVDSLSPRIDKSILAKKHINLDKWNGEKVDILTLGDSFSQGAAGGLNPFYQDYIAAYSNQTVINIQILEKKANYLEMIYLLQNSGLLDKIKPKIIIIESTERSVLERLAIDNIDTNKTLEMKSLQQLLRDTKWSDKTLNSQISFINNININALKYNFLYHYDDNAYTSNCYITTLNKKLFTSKDPYSLLFYKETIKYNDSITTQKVEKLNANLNSLALKLKSKGIKLYFMPAVDKLNLYSKYTVENKYGQNTFFEQLRPMKKEYELIDTKAILEKEIDRGVKDVFYSDDTHWSYKASEAIAKNLSEFQDGSK
jgi:hypothetical protein